VSDATVTGDVAPDAVWVVPPSLEVHVAEKLVIVAPPSLFAVKATMPALLPRVTPVTLGAAGAEAATKELEAVEAGLSPVPLVAITVQVYVFAFVSVVTVSGEVAPEAVRVVPPSLEVQVTVKPVMALPPLPFAVKATIAAFVPRVTPVNDGAAGTVPARSELEAEEAELVPMPFVAVTVQVYVLPLVRVVTVIGELPPVAVRVVPPSLDVQVTAKTVTVAPLLLPAVNVTTAELLPPPTPVMLGAEGVVAATKELEAVEAGLSPVALVATAVQV